MILCSYNIRKCKCISIWVGARDCDTHYTCRLDVDEGSNKKQFTSSCHHAWIQEFLSAGEGVQARRPDKRLDNVFILILNLFYSLQKGSNGFITE